MLFVGLSSFPLSIMKTDLSRIPGDLGDARFNNYVLEHGYQYLNGDVHDFWDAPMMYPCKNVIAFSDNLIGTMPIYALFRKCGSDRETSFQYWILALFALNFIACFWALYKWQNNIILASVGAYIFAFGIYLLGQLEHAQVFPRFAAPLTFYWFFKFLQTYKNNYFFYFLFGLVFQFYCGVYLGFILFYCILFYFISHMIIYRDFNAISAFCRSKKMFFALISIVVALISLWPMMSHYLSITKITGMRSFGELEPTISRPIAYFFTHVAATTWRGILSDHSQFAFEQWWSHFMFMGAVLWIAIITGIILLLTQHQKIDKRNLKSILLSLFLCLLFTTNFNGFSLYRCIYALPGFSSMRSIDRFINLESLVFVITMILVFSELLKISNKWKYLVYTLPFLVIVDNRICTDELKSFDKGQSQKKVHEVQCVISNNYDCKSSAIAFMVSNNSKMAPGYHDKLIEDHITIILAAQALKVPVVNAYTGHYPEKYIDYFDNMDEQSLIEWSKKNGIDDKTIQRISAPVGDSLNEPKAN